MNNNTKHTFVILAYKESPYLEECILSLLRQTVKSEILLSTSTPSFFLSRISKKYDIPIISNARNEGIASDWYFAFKNSKTKYVTLAHQDDIYFPNYAEQCLLSANRIKNNLITFTDYIEVFNDRIRRYNLLLITKRMMLFPYYIFKNNISSPFFTKLMLSFGNPICCPSIMYNKDNIGQFKFDKSFSMNLDWDAALRLSKMKGNFIYINKKLLIRRIHKKSETTNALRTKNRQYEDRIIFEKLWPKSIALILSYIYSIGYKSNG